jgi:hypothetical protein
MLSKEISVGLKMCCSIAIPRYGIGVVGEVGFTSRKKIIITIDIICRAREVEKQIKKIDRK